MLTHCSKKKFTKPTPLVLAGLLFLVLSNSALAQTNTQLNSPDRYLAEELKNRLEHGEGVWLKTTKGEFYAVFTPDLTGQPQGATIIIHDTGGHADWPDVIHPLRTNFPKHHWASLSITLPVMDSQAELTSQLEEVYARIDESIRELHRRSLNNIVLVGHGLGAMAATHYLAKMEQKDISAFVAISLGAETKQDDELFIPSQLEKITLPILDIYAAQDKGDVLDTAELRALAARKSSSKASQQKTIDPYRRSTLATLPNNKTSGYIAYRQVQLDGTNHYFQGSNQRLTKRIVGWLMRHARGVSVNR